MHPCWAIILVMLMAFSTHAEDEGPPYLYYYSNTLNAFVVERADGSDSRILGEGLVQGNVLPVGWSPSGEWFAWMDYRLDTEDRLWHVLSADSTQHFEWANGRTYTEITWSPTHDLFFGVQYPGHSVDGDSTHFILIDVTNNKTITQFARTTDYANSLSQAAWSPDGKFVAFYYQTRDPSTREATWHFVLVSQDGTVTEQALGPTSFRPDIELGEVHWTRQGWVAHASPNGEHLIVANPSQADQFEVETSASKLIWSPAGEYALSYVRRPSDPSQTIIDLWLLSVPERRMERVAENIHATNTYPINPFQVALFNFVDSNFNASWSPDGKQAVFRMTAEGRFAILDPTTGQVDRLPLEAAADEFDRYDINVRWSPEGQTLQFENDTADIPIQTIDLTTGKESEIEAFGIIRTAYSPSGHYLAIAGMDGSVIDITTQTTYPLPIHSASVYNKVQYVWHPDEEWLITVDHLCIAGDCPAILRYAITNPQGTYWRELESSQVDWLPSQVDVSKLAVGTPESVLLAPEFIDRSVEFAYGSDDRSLQAGCDPADDYVLLIQEQVSGNTLYRLRDSERCYGANGEVHIGISPDDRLLALASRYTEGTGTLWEVANGQLLARFNCTCFEMNFSADGTKLFTRASSAMLTWDVGKILEGQPSTHSKTGYGAGQGGL